MKIKINIVIALIAAFSCSRNDLHNEAEHAEHEGIVSLTEQQRKALDLKLGGFEIRPMTTVVRTNGQLEVPPTASADITAVIGGNVKEILVFHGDKVNKGQPVVILEHPDYITLQQEYAEVSGNLEFLESEYKRQKDLFENNIGSEKNYQQAMAEYNMANARHRGLKSRLELLNIDTEKVINGNLTTQIRVISPISGYVNDVGIRLGSYVQPGDKLFLISNNNEIHADFMVYEKDIHLLRPGQKINFTVANRPGEELSATIFAIGQEFESNSRAVHLHARLDHNPGNLIPGMYVSGHIHSGTNTSRTLPEDAIVSDGSKSFIFIKSDRHDEESDGSSMDFRMVEVITGQIDEGYIEVDVLDSVPENAQIVLNAAYYLLADMKKDETSHEH